MRKVTVSELPSLENKESVPSIQGTITKLYDYKTGEGAQGPWSIQNGFFKDSTGDVKILITNQPDAKRYLNKEILVASHKSDKGLSGVYAHDDTYKGETKRVLKLTATADINYVDASSRAAEPPRARPDEPGVPGQPVDAVSKLKHGLMRVLNAFYIIEKGVQVQVEQAKIGGIDTTDENFGGKCAQAYRTLDSMGLIQALPDKPLWGAQKQLEEKPIEDDEVPW